MPADDLEALLNPPDYLQDIADGSAEDSVDAFNRQNVEDETSRRYQQALGSTRVIKAFDNKAVRLPGYIVPLQQNAAKKVTEFFIVPYFGACLHMPPPPPNQIIYARFSPGIEVHNLYDPFWFSGTLSVDTTANSLGTSAYSIHLEDVVPYEE